MKLKRLLIVNAVILGCSGIVAILLPSNVLSLYGVESGPAVKLMAQYAGLGSFVIGFIAWFSKNVKDSKAQNAIILAFLITYVIGAIISVFGTLSDLMKNGWAVVGIYLLFSLAYASVLFQKKK